MQAGSPPGPPRAGDLTPPPAAPTPSTEAAPPAEAEDREDPRSERLRAVIQDFITQLCQEFHPEQDHAFKTRVLRLIQHELPPFRGRPRAPEIREALRYQRQGLRPDQIARIINPEYARWDPYRREHYRRGLKKAMRYAARGGEKNPPNFHPPKNSP